MDVTYLGHSSFKLRGKKATVVTDPYPNSIGLVMPRVSADLVTVSHFQHDDHKAIEKVSGSSRRPEPYVVGAPGEYEVSGVGVFGWQSYHDDKEGTLRGKNTIYVIHIDGVKVAHLGDLGHTLSQSLADNLGEIDVLLIPVGGVYTIDGTQAAKIVRQLQPGYVVPMHYKTPEHNQETFGAMDDYKKFTDEMGEDQPKMVDKLTVDLTMMPEETEIVVLTK